MTRAERLYLIMLVEWSRKIIKANRLSSQRDYTIGFDPDWVDPGHHLPDGLANYLRCAETGELLKETILLADSLANELASRKWATCPGPLTPLDSVFLSCIITNAL